jgi:hypothetical protein
MASFFKIPGPGCGKSLKVSDKLGGKNRACPYCNAAVKIPEATHSEPEDELPNLQIVETRKAARVKSAGGSRRRKIVRQKQDSSWLRSSSDSASSDVSIWLSGLVGLIAAIVWYALMFPIRDTFFGAMFWQRGPIPFPTTFLMFWALSILALKSLRLNEQKRAMLVDVLPREVSEEITLESIDNFIDYINDLPSNGRDSFLINRVVRGIEHFRVRKSAAETVTMMESQSVIDDNNVAGSYTIIKVFIWALPILGFIGTVMGVSAAVAWLAGSRAEAIAWMR